jgi:hypothetical protein
VTGETSGGLEFEVALDGGVLDGDYDIVEAEWLNEPPREKERELPDELVKVPLESPFVNKLRHDGKGPYIVAPDSADWAPPDLLAVPDTSLVQENAQKRNEALDEENVPSGAVALPAGQRGYLTRAAHPASLALMDALDRGLEAGSVDLATSVKDRRRKRRLF